MKTREVRCCLTVRELKELLQDVPDQDASGEESEVWMMTGESLSSPIRNIAPLSNGGIVFGCEQWS